MSTAVITILNNLRGQLDELAAGLSAQEWLEPSACARWRVRDAIAHLAASARAPIDPLPEPPGAPPLPEDRERQHDVFVDRRRSWSTDEVLAEFRAFAPRYAAFLAGLQEEPAASRLVPVPGLGAYPAHTLANGVVFDYYCHMRHDIVQPGGPIQRELPEPEHATVYAAVQWMMLGLPQMQGHDLDDAVTAPVTFALTGPGESQWTVRRPDPVGGLIVEERADSEVVVTCSAHSFIAWATKRRDWRADCAITGPAELAIPLLDALNIT